MPDIESQTQSIAKLYREAEQDIISELRSATTYRRRELALIQRRIAGILTRLNKKADPVVEKAVRDQYEDGMDEAVAAIKAEGASISAKFSVIDEEAVAAFANEMTSLLGEASQGAQRSTSRLLTRAQGRAILARIARGRILGRTLDEIKASISDELSHGMVVLRDRRGRAWSMSTYAEMLARTKMTEATNTGLSNRLAREGVDLVKVSDHSSDHQACRQFEGKILSTTGETEIYQGKRVPTVEEAKQDGLFHPNCKHRLLPYKPAVAEQLNL